MTPSEFFAWQLAAASGVLLAIVVAGFFALVVCAVREQWRQGDPPGSSHIPAVAAPLSLRLVRNGRDEPLMRSQERGAGGVS